jgi:hypothetical protein
MNKILTFEDLMEDASKLYVKHFPDAKPLTELELENLTNQLISRPGAKNENCSD